MTYYSFLLGMGAVIGLLRLARVTPRANRNAWLLAGLGIYLGALIGARLGYSLEHFAYFSRHPAGVFAFWSGGFTWQGGVIGAFCSLVLLSKLWKKSFWALIDTTSIMLLPLAVTLWLGAWTEGVAYGVSLPEGTWWALPSADVYGEAGLHAPVQLLAALALLVAIGVFEGLTLKLKQAGLRGTLIWLVFSLLMLVFTWLRADPSPLLLNLRVETWFAILFSVIFIFLSLGLYFASRPSQVKDPSRLTEELKDEPL